MTRLSERGAAPMLWSELLRRNPSLSRTLRCGGCGWMVAHCVCGGLSERGDFQGPPGALERAATPPAIRKDAGTPRSLSREGAP